MSKARLVLAFFAFFCAAVAGDDVRTASFSVGGAAFKFPLPDGYCLVQGRYTEIADTVAKLDPVNHTDASFIDCAEMAKGVDQEHWGAVKSVIATESGNGPTRGELIGYFKKSINPADIETLNHAAADVVGGQFDKQLGAKVDLKVDVKPLAFDDVAAYGGGRIDFTLPNGGKYPVACVFAATVLNGRVFNIYLFTVYTSPADIVTLLDKVKPVARAFVAANGG